MNDKNNPSSPAPPEAVPQGGQWPKIIAASRNSHGDAVTVFFERRVTDDEMAAVHATLAPPSPQPPAAPDLAALKAEAAHWKLVADTKTAIANRLADDVEALRAKPPAAQAGEMTDDEALTLQQVADDFETDGETSVEYATLMGFEARGFVECVHFNVTPEGEQALEKWRERAAHGIGTAKPAQAEGGAS